MQTISLANLRLWLSKKFRPPAETLPLLNALYSTVEVTIDEQQADLAEIFIVKIQGAIRCPDELLHTSIQIMIDDVTDTTTEPAPVHSSHRQWQKGERGVFCYTADLGKLPAGLTRLEKWTSVASIERGWLVLPRKGSRILRFSISVISEKSRKMAGSACNVSYENADDGYIDMQERIEQAKILAVTVAFAVSAADGHMPNCELDVIKDWAQKNILAAASPEKIRWQLEKALNRTAQMLRAGNRIDCIRVCDEIIRIAPSAMRYDIIELCLQVCRAKGTVTDAEISLMKNLAQWLQVDEERFRQLVEKLLPAEICQVKDDEIILGIKSGMTRDQKRRRLNEQYRKWSARVTNFDPRIRQQATYMLQFIAESRTEQLK